MQDITPLPDAGNEPAITLAESLAQPSAADRKWTVAIIASCLLHVAAAAAFLIAPAGTFDTGDAIQSEGTDQLGADVLGTALKNPAPDAIDVTLVADPQPAKPEAAQPVPPTEAPQPIKTPAAPKSAPEAAEQATVAPYPLTAAIPNDQSVAPEAETSTPSAVQTQSSEAPPADKPAVDLPAERPPVPSQRPSAPISGETGGTADGEEREAPAVASKGEKQGAAGNAMESGYSVEVQNKLVRANRHVSKKIQEKARNNARVVFVVMADGSISDLQLAESSGSAELDQFALKLVRQQAPFPPIPPETGLSSWVFRARIGPF
ncbi:energy transducer TonB family protein [Mesorhizobium neociceri]|uniref:TonB family protein n=1 Tax=Mesorhizobium neociceri TaxID=1307853 RepID=A0A838AY16_9HYPH|nr:TonB family protein [Mesorhizobium neociceri]MBA1139336.1 TonB family protein [Mesorhizobium neociceri]